MGVIGELFPGQKLADEGSEDSDGQGHQPRLDLDLDSGVVRIARTGASRSAEDRSQES
ncbi:hypothetical protein AB0C34_25245 [Nocardia sp. NPDC049220]|uniref:hypothetical protein n=1 Tax=Nocardia sp. NPDC049220 TaxID=3155273 RepID=UPI0033D1E9E6